MDAGAATPAHAATPVDKNTRTATRLGFPGRRTLHRAYKEGAVVVGVDGVAMRVSALVEVAEQVLPAGALHREANAVPSRASSSQAKRLLPATLE